MRNIVTATAANIDEIIERSEYLLIDFSATWCAPCRGFEKVIETVASEYPEFTFAKIDIDEEKSLAAEFSIRSVPAIMILRKKLVVYADSGALTISTLRELLDQAKVVVGP